MHGKPCSVIFYTVTNRFTTNSVTAYIRYSTELESANTILSFNGKTILDRKIIVSFGFTRYCQSFLNHWNCVFKPCRYLHKFAKDENILYEEELVS
jgi:hypothetical protein